MSFMFMFLIAQDRSCKKADKLCFIGYCTRSKGCRLFDDKTRKLNKSRDESDFDLGKSEVEAGEQTELVNVNPESSRSEEEPGYEQ